jgi:protein TonB
MQDTSESLFRELNRLKATFSPLSERLATAGEQFRDSGIPMSENLITGLSEFRNSVADLGRRVVALGRELSLPTDLQVATLEDLGRSLQLIADVEKRRSRSTESSARELFRKPSSPAASRPLRAEQRLGVSSNSSRAVENDADEEIEAILANMDRVATQAGRPVSTGYDANRANALHLVQRPASQSNLEPTAVSEDAASALRFTASKAFDAVLEPAELEEFAGLGRTQGKGSDAEALCQRLLATQKKKAMVVRGALAVAVLGAAILGYAAVQQRLMYADVLLERFIGSEVPAPPLPEPPVVSSEAGMTLAAIQRPPDLPQVGGMSRQVAVAQPAPPAIRLLPRTVQPPKEAAQPSAPKQAPVRKEGSIPPPLLSGFVGVSPRTGEPAGAVLSGLVGSTAPAVRPPAPPPPERIRIGGQVASAQLTSQTKVAYPAAARKLRIQGMVRLEAIISKDGTVENLAVISGHQLLNQAAIDAVKQWRYQPTMLNGEPVEVITTVDVTFRLDE